MSLLMVLAVSCSTVQRTSESDYGDERSTTRRMILVDPNYGYETILVRDASTGRYYQVQTSRYGNYNDPFYSPYSSYNNRYYNSRNNNRYYSVPRGSGNSNSNQRSEEQKADDRRKLDEAKKTILGNKN
jgi:hypothetical protein